MFHIICSAILKTLKYSYFGTLLPSYINSLDDSQQSISLDKKEERNVKNLCDMSMDNKNIRTKSRE